MKYLFRYHIGAEQKLLTKDNILQLCKDETIDERARCAPHWFFGITLADWVPIKSVPEFSDHVPKMNRERQLQIAEEAKTNPPLDANCYILKNKNKEGPYTPKQIKTMWDAGTLLADTLYVYEGIPDWVEAKRFCENPKWKGSSPDNDTLLAEMVKEQKVTSNRVLWIGLMIAAVFVIPFLLMRSCS